LELARLRKDPRQAYRSGGTWNDAYWRTLCADVVRPKLTGEFNDRLRRTVPEDKRLFKSWLNKYAWSFRLSEANAKSVLRPWPQKLVQACKASVSKQWAHSVMLYGQSIVTASMNRRFYVTSTGYLGIGPKDTQTGDEVYAINGSKVPLVLRRDALGFRDKNNRAKEDTTDPTYPHFRLVGDCYTHGMMDGEAVQDPGKESYLVLC